MWTLLGFGVSIVPGTQNDQVDSAHCLYRQCDVTFNMLRQDNKGGVTVCDVIKDREPAPSRAL